MPTENDYHGESSVPISREDAHLANRYAGKACTLDGEPARIIGRLNAMATVGRLDGKGECQWSWPAVDRVMRSGGKFLS